MLVLVVLFLAFGFKGLSQMLQVFFCCCLNTIELSLRSLTQLIVVIAFICASSLPGWAQDQLGLSADEVITIDDIIGGKKELPPLLDDTADPEGTLDLTVEEAGVDIASEQAVEPLPTPVEPVPSPLQEEPLDKKAQLQKLVQFEQSETFDAADLRSRSAATRLAAATYLVANEAVEQEDRHQAILALGELLRVGNNDVRSTTVEVLKVLGPEAAPVLHRVEVAIHAGALGAEGVELLGSIGSRAAVEGLANLLSHKDEKIEKSALLALGKIGPAAQPAVANLLRLLEEDHHSLLVLDALGEIGGPRVITVATGLVSSEDKEKRIKAAEVLAKQGPVAFRAVPALRRMEASTDPAVKDAANRALAKIAGLSDF